MGKRGYGRIQQRYDTARRLEALTHDAGKAFRSRYSERDGQESHGKRTSARTRFSQNATTSSLEIARLREAHAEQSDRQIANGLGVSYSKTEEIEKWSGFEMRQSGMTLEAIAKADGTVTRRTIQRAIVDDGQMPNVSPTVTDTKGRKQPTKRPPRPQTVADLVRLIR
jgi:uncharacterized protein YkuJ